MVKVIWKHTLDEFNEKLKILENNFVKSKLEQYDNRMKGAITNIRLQCTVFFGFLAIFQLFHFKNENYFYVTINVLLLGIMILTCFIASSEFNYRFYKFKINEIYSLINADNYDELYSKLMIEDGFDKDVTFKFFPKLTGFVGILLALLLLYILPITSSLYFQFNFITLFIFLQTIFFCLTIYSYCYNNKYNSNPPQ